MADFHALAVKSIKKLTPSSVAVTFSIPKALVQNYAFTAGQYITVKKELKGKELRRAYSISSSPKEADITIGIKKVDHGHLRTTRTPNYKWGCYGDYAPEGRFVFKPSDSVKNIAAFAAGSGITPVMSIAKSVLDANPKNKFVLIYGNKSYEDTMFYSDLVKLELDYTNRFFVYFTNSQTREESIIWPSDTSTVNYALKNKHKDVSFDSYYLCGPEKMIHLVTDTLLDNGIPKDKVHFELFTATGIKDEMPVTADGKTSLTVIVDDEEFN